MCRGILNPTVVHRTLDQLQFDPLAMRGVLPCKDARSR